MTDLMKEGTLAYRARFPSRVTLSIVVSYSVARIGNVKKAGWYFF